MISTGLATCLRQTAVLLVAVGTCVPSISNAAAADQILDQVEVFGLTKLLRLKEDPPPKRFVGLAASAALLRSCQASNVNGLFCLDNEVIRHWPATVAEHDLDTAFAPEAGTTLFSCRDTGLGLGVTASNPCTTMTADASGNVWIAGRKSDGTSSLIKVVKKGEDSCPVGGAFSGVSTSGASLIDLSAGYCHSVFRSGRGSIEDLSPIEGDLVTQFFPGAGLLAVEGRSKVVFYPFNTAEPVKEWSDWGVSVSAGQIRSASILQRDNLGTIYTHGLIATSSGVVISKKLGTSDATSGDPVPVVNLNSDTGPFPRGTKCEVNVNFPDTFRIRGSETTGRLFATNRNYCKAYVIEPVYNGFQDLSGAVVPGPSTGSALLPTGGTTLYPPEGLSVVPGISVNVANCSSPFGCILLGDSDDGNEYPAARMYGVTVEGTATGLIVYKLEDIPDCRYIKNLFPAECTADTIVPIAGSTKPQQQYLNVTPLLPSNVTDLFDASGKKPFGLPPIYISPRYRAQASEGYKFQALFGVADPNIQFRKTFTVEFDIGDFNLAGSSLGCGVQQTDNATPPNPTPLRFNKWDIVTVVSERFSSVGGPKGIVLDSAAGDAEHVDTLINKGCYNPTPSAGTRWSMYSYNLALAEDKLTGSSATYSPAIAYLSNLLLSLHTDLGDTQKRLACANVDAVGNTLALPDNPPFTRATCNTLDNQWANAQDKLRKCALASQNPKNSAPNQNCKAFISQFDTYKTVVETSPRLGTDPANRIGELWSRTDVIRYVYSHFLKAADIKPAAADADPLSPP